MAKGRLKSFYITKELNDWLREHAFKTKQSQGEIIRKALREYSNEQDSVYCGDSFHFSRQQADNR